MLRDEFNGMLFVNFGEEKFMMMMNMMNARMNPRNPFPDLYLIHVPVLLHEFCVSRP